MQVSTLPEGKEIAIKTTYSIRRGESCSSYHRKLKSNREANLSLGSLDEIFAAKA